MFVKVCGITNLEDAAAAVEAGADALGFNFWPKSPRYLDIARARAIAKELPPQILKVGVFVDQHDDEIADGVGLDLVQVHGELAAEPRRPFWAAWPATLANLEGRIRMSSAQAFLIDTPAGEQRGGTGRTFDWKMAFGLPGRVILAGGLKADNVKEAIHAAQPWGVDACSCLESAPGIKDHTKIREFVRAARSAEI